jgi:hypothetical protein
MRRPTPVIVWCFACAAFGTGVARAQGRGGAAWTTYDADAQRTSAIRTDPRISRESLQRPGFQFVWKAKLDNQPRQLNSLTQPLLLPNIISYKGFKALAFVGGSADNVYAIDYELNRMFWTRHFNITSSGAGTPQCPGGLTAITRATPLSTSNPAAARGAMGGPGAAPGGPPQVPSGGAPPLPRPPPGGPGRAAAAPGAPGGPGRGPAPGGGGGGNLSSAVYAIAGDGTVHVLNPQTGEDLSPPVKFLGPGAKVTGSILVDNLLYAATADACGSVPNGVYAVDLGVDSKTVSKWETKGGSVVGNAAPTLGTDGTVYAATGDGEYAASSYSDSVMALGPKTLAFKDSFSPGKTPFTSAPVVFAYKGKDFVIAANKDGRLYLLDSASLGGADHKTPAAKSAQYASTGSESLATWEEADGTRWVVASSNGPLGGDARFPTMNGGVTNGGIVAFKVVEQGSGLALQPAWASRDIPAASSPIVINGVVFALASGSQRSPAVLYALDGLSGKELWNSGTTIGSFVHSGGLSGGDGQVYVGTYDSTLYAFGIPLEH